MSARDNDAALGTLRDAGLSPECRIGGLTLTERAAVDRPDDIAALLAEAGHPPIRLLVEREDLESFLLHMAGANVTRRDAIWAELLKVRRSKLPWVTAPAFMVVAAVGGPFMFILQDPDRARRFGLLVSKEEAMWAERT